ncbi:hypothetical protein CH63R_02627 [Colletotrichum higginsianum IMI 349063]|uniref:Secreted protein n=2 Tax=Colletotrichum higginsianum TaxID=80884 RepID=A0A1B7YPB8_COLHI|nr:hypothetical protein CH63R_02627 [Colletotrichum higginsianum IMI 349063]OBR13901.1 hypothetical protein CH63R_02627 [Colletotrichum higginsianum IMI 349063]TID02176.1 hypothetical protein CH35J_004082 [Colletotrichum higginsianum]
MESKVALCRICCTAWLLVPVPGVRDSPLASMNEWDLYRRTVGARDVGPGFIAVWAGPSGGRRRRRWACACACSGKLWHSPKRLTGHDWQTRDDWQKPEWQPRGGSVAACANP